MQRAAGAAIVVDLGFGDAGKGLLTDHLVRRQGADLVVRFNGGAQAGHNVVCPDGRHHTFAQFGSGSFVEGTRTILSRYVAVHPTALLLEGEALRRKGLSDIFSRLLISDRAPLITPFHQAAGRLRETARGADRHGSCGIGFGETVHDGLLAGDEALSAGDLRDRSRLRRKLFRVKDRMWSEVRSLPGERLDSPEAVRERAIFERSEVPDAWIDEAVRLAEMGLVAPEPMLVRWMRSSSGIVFEGAQGVLLDESRGFHPYTTWSRCTFDNALELLSEAMPDVRARRIGVMRAYAVRHGPGPLPTEDDALDRVVSEHNREGAWQGAVRYGWFDGVLMRYALDAVGSVDALAVTHLDVPVRTTVWKLASAYAPPSTGVPEDLVAGMNGDGSFERLSLVPGPSLSGQSRLTRLLFESAPRYKECQSQEASVIAEIERLLARRVDAVSRGPSAYDVHWRS